MSGPTGGGGGGGGWGRRGGDRKGGKGVLPLTDTSSDAAAVSQASSNKPRGQCRRDRQKTASPRSPDEMPETGCVAVSCRRPTNTVPRVEPVESCLGQSLERGVQKASATPDAP